MLRKSSLLALMLAAPTSAFAQEAGQRDGEASDIVVTATRTEQKLEDVPASIAVQNVDELRRNGFTFGTDEFRGVTGISFRRGEGDGDEFPFVSVRGSTGTDGFLALLDGVPFVGLFEEPLLAEVPYDALERVEIVKGPLSALYGRGALYGAVNYITRSPREDRITAALGGGSDDFYRAEARFSRTLGENAGVLLGGAYENYEGWRDNSEREIFSLFGKADVDLGSRTKLTGFGYYLDRFTEVPNGIPVGRDGRVVDVVGGRETFLGFGRPFGDVQGGIGTLKIEHQASDALSFSVTGQYRRYERESFLNFYDSFGFDPSRNVAAFNGFRNTTGQTVYFGEATATLKAGAHIVLAGVSGERAKSSEFNRWTGQNGFTEECGFTFFLIEVDYTTGNIVNRDHPCFVSDVPLTRSRLRNRFYGGFIQDEWRLSDRLTLTLGGRYDLFRRRATFDPFPASGAGGTLRLKADAFSPKAALSYRTGFGQVYISYGRGFNSNFGAGFENDPAQYARPGLKPTTIDSYELGVKGRALDDLIRFEAAVYYTRQKNRRVFVPNPAAEEDFTQPPTLITFGDLYDGRGAELSVNLRPRDGTSLTVNYSYVDPEWKRFILQTFGGPVDLSGKTPTGVSKNIVYLAAEQRVTPWLYGRATFEYYDDYAITLDNRIEGGGYELLTLNARIQPESWRGITLDLTLNNALDKEYYFFFGGRTNPTAANPGPPRQFRATLRASF